MKLVNTNITARASRTIPRVPEIVSVKKRIPTIAAIINLIILSAVPIFFFIFENFNVCNHKINGIVTNMK